MHNPYWYTSVYKLYICIHVDYEFDWVYSYKSDTWLVSNSWTIRILWTSKCQNSHNYRMHICMKLVPFRTQATCHMEAKITKDPFVSFRPPCKSHGISTTTTKIKWRGNHRPFMTSRGPLCGISKMFGLRRCLAKRNAFCEHHFNLNNASNTNSFPSTLPETIGSIQKMNELSLQNGRASFSIFHQDC